MNFMGSMCKMVRITAWLLAAVTLLTVFSGFFTAKFFLTPLGYSLSYFIHVIIIPILFVPLFYLHTFAGLMVLLTRHARFNKKIIKAAVAVAWTGVLVLFIALYTAQAPTANTGTNATLSQGGINASTTAATLTATEVAKHSSPSDCWMIINSKVYDVTSYLPYHPGGAGTILQYCGSDGTAAFDTRGGTGSHSAYASSLLGSYYIGNVGGVVSGQSPPAQNQTQAAIPSRRQRDDD